MVLGDDLGPLLRVGRGGHVLGFGALGRDGLEQMLLGDAPTAPAYPLLTARALLQFVLNSQLLARERILAIIAPETKSR